MLRPSVRATKNKGRDTEDGFRRFGSRGRHSRPGVRRCGPGVRRFGAGVGRCRAGLGAFFACMGLALMQAAAAHAADGGPLVLLVESHGGSRPSRMDEYVRAVNQGLEAPQPLSGERLDALIAEKLSAAAGDASYPLLEFVRGQVLDVQEDVTRARFGDAVARMERLLTEVQRHAAAVAAEPRIRRVLFEGRLAQLKALLRLRRQSEAEAVAVELGRSFPDFAVVERDHGPEVTQFVVQVKRQAWPKNRGALTVETSSVGASVFLNERYVGLSPVRLTDLLPGRYRVMARLGELQSRVHTVTVSEEPVDLRIDLGFDSALDAFGFRFANEAERLKREPAYALRLGRALGAAEVITVGLGGTAERPQLVAAVYNVASGNVLRQAAVALGPSPPPYALVVALGRFLRGGQPMDGLIVSAAPTVRGGELAPLHVEGRVSRRGRGLLALSIVGYVLAAGAAGGGAYLIAIDGEGTCATGRCPEVYKTLWPGVATVAASAALAAGATYLLVRSKHAARSGVIVAPAPRGATLGAWVRF